MKIPTYTIQVNPFESGVLLGLIEFAEERTKIALSGVRNQLISVCKDIEKAAGVVKKSSPMAC